MKPRENNLQKEWKKNGNEMIWRGKDEEKMEKKSDRVPPPNQSPRLMNVQQRGAASPQGAAPITDRAWLGVVIESNDN